MSDSKKQSTKALKKVEGVEREMRQIRALLEGREGGSGASFKPWLADEGDVRHFITLAGSKIMHTCSSYVGSLVYTQHWEQPRSPSA